MRARSRTSVPLAAAVVIALATSVLPAAATAAAAPTPAATPAAGDPAAGPPAARVTDCTVSEILENPCRPWVGAVADYYPGLRTWRDQILAHEQRIGRRLDVVHQYHRSHQTTLTADERYFAERGTIVYLNWKPADIWSDAAGGNAAVNAQIDQMATSIGSLGDTKIMLALYGEPERFVTPGTSACPGLKGAAGSPADYIAMWANVQDRFAAAGTDNVVWAMNYLGYVGWDCLFPELWPGNDRVDWVLWDPYVGPRQTWDNEVGYFYRALEQRADAEHDYTSKPWGLAEYGYWRGTADQTWAYRMYADARAALNAGRYPRLKLYEIYDTVSGSLDIRTSYSATGVLDPAEQAAYNAFANDPLLTDGTPPPVETDHFAACDTGVESGLSCFGGTYGGGVYPTRTSADAHGGSFSVEVRSRTASGTYGLNVRPAPVSATEVGRQYTGGVWVKASRVGLPITLLLRERRPADGTAPPNGYTATTWTASDLGWHQVAGSYTAKEPGNTITYSVYGTGMAAGTWLRADDFTLRSVGPAEQRGATPHSVGAVAPVTRSTS